MRYAYIDTVSLRGVAFVRAYDGVCVGMGFIGGSYVAKLGSGRTKLIGLLALLAMLVPMFAVTPVASQDNGKVLRIHQTTDPDMVDPQKSSFTSEIELLSMNYEGLTRQDENLNTVPAAAESWEFNEDGTVLTFHIREGLTYSDGSPLTAERFRYAIERTCDPNTAGQYQSILFEIVGCAEFAGSLTAPEVGEGTPAAEVDPAAYETTKAALGAKAIDDLTLELTLTDPAPYYPTVASLWVFYPAKQELIEQGGDEWWKDPALQLGNGPFQMTEYAEEQQVSFVANENYWGGRPKLDGIEIVYQGESAVALEAYPHRRPRHLPGRPAADSGDPGGQRAGQPDGDVPGCLDLQSLLQPDHGAIQRHQGARGLLPGVRPRDLLRGGSQWRLHADLELDPTGSSGLDRDRQVRVQCRGSRGRVGRVELRRSGWAAGDQALLQQR